MRQILYLATLVLLFSCKQSNNEQQKVDILKESKFKNLLTKYKDISFDTLKVFSTEDPDNKLYMYKGIKLDTTDVLLFPKSIAEQYLDDDGFFACYKFLIDNSRIGLITRTPSTYASSSIKLLILDIQKDTITEIIELGETFGDAGDMAIKTSWLFKDSSKKYKSITWVEESHDHSVENEKDTTIESWNNYYLIDLSKSSIDTISTDEKMLTKKFKTLFTAPTSQQ
jgi:hypothetical protein